jgi:hypothetical protein
MHENQFLKSQTLSLIFYSQHVISTALRALARRIEGDWRANHGTMSSSALTDLIIALLHEVAGPHRRHHHGRRGGWRHRHSAVAPVSPPPPPPSTVPHRRVLEWPPSPSPDRPVSRSLLSDLDAHPRGHQGWPCAIHGWDCPNRAAPVHDPSSSSRQEEEKMKTTSARSRWSPAPLGHR